MLQVFIDDSGIRQPPVYVMAGWIADADRWPAFSEEWAATLGMSPAIGYFKFAEAAGLAGEFSGVSPDSRDHKMRALIYLLEEYGAVGISASIPHEVFQQFLSRVEGPLGNPYALLFYGVIHRVLSYCRSEGIDDEIEFVFDTQTDQMAEVLRGWDELLAVAPPDVRRLLTSRPRFENDRIALPLQAADLHAGWLRRMDSAMLRGESQPDPFWGERGDQIRREFWFMWPDVAIGMFTQMFGHRPITYTFGYEYPPRWISMGSL